MNRIRSAIGAALMLIGGFIAMFIVAHERLRLWRERRKMAAHESRFKKEINRIRNLVEQQRDMIMKQSRERVEADERERRRREAAANVNR